MSLVSEGADYRGSLSAGTGLAEPSLATVGDYFTLMKPRVMSLVVFTALVGLAVAPGSLHPVTAFTALLCIAVGAGAAGALNMWYDADVDAVMTRTSRRPVPMGRVQPGEALAFGLTLAGFSVATLGLLVNWLAAGLLAFTIFFYVAIYTAWLKRSTPQNIVIGGAAGAIPPLVGWAAMTNSLDLSALYLFAIIFYWTPPHFWALALIKQQDYAKAGIPMLPVVKGPHQTKLQMLVYTLLLLPLTVLPTLAGTQGVLYAVVALLLGARLLWYCVRLLRETSVTPLAWKMYKYSLLYLALLFCAMGIDKRIPFGHRNAPDIVILDKPDAK